MCARLYLWGLFLLKKMSDNPESHHIGFISNQRHDMYITSQLNILEEKIVSYQKLFVKKIL